MSTQFRILPLVHHHLRSTVDEVLAAGCQFTAEPAGAAFLEGFEETFGLALQAETGAGLQFVKSQGVGVIVGIVAVHRCLNLFGDRMGKRDAARVFFEEGLEVGREEAGMGGEQPTVLLLPLVAMGLHGTIFQVRLEVRRLVEENPEEEVMGEISVDAYFVKIMGAEGSAVVAQLRCPLAGDMEMNLVEVEIIINPIHCTGRQVIGEYPAVSFFVGQNVGQSQSLRL